MGLVWISNGPNLPPERCQIQGEIMKTRIILFTLLLLSIATVAQAAGPQERFADFEGIRLHYQDFGAGSEAVVLIHGWNCDHTFWRLQAPDLAKKWRVIVVDLPGHGLSDKPRLEYTMKLFARSVAAVLAKAGIEKVVLAGHSMGYLVAREFCVAHPDMVKGLVIVDGAFLQAPKNDQEQKQYQQLAEHILGMFSGDGYAEGVRKFVEPMHDKATSAEVRQEVLQKMQSTPPHVGRNSLKHFFDLVNWREMAVSAPTLALFVDSPDSPPDLEKQLRSVHPTMELVMWKDAGHFFMLEKPAEFNQALVDFITAVGLNAKV